MIIEGKVYGLYINPDRNTILTRAVEKLEFDFEGIVGDKHNYIARQSDVRDRELLEDKNFVKGLEVRNWRMWSGDCFSELQQIAINLKVDTTLFDSSLLGDNICFQGIPKFSKIPRGSTIHFSEDTILQVEDENTPCDKPGQLIAEYFPQIKAGDFVKVAQDKRGLVGVVYKPGIVSVGDKVKVHIYQPKPYFI